MEPIKSIAQRSSALTTAAAPLQESLSKEDSSTLLALMETLMRRYPSQDQGETATEYFRDFEQLALKYSLPKVARAIQALRIDPEQKFFPRPDEVADEIEHQRETGLRRATNKDGEEYLRKLDQWREQYNSPEEIEWRKTLR